MGPPFVSRHFLAAGAVLAQWLLAVVAAHAVGKPDIDPPLRLEYELRTHVEHMAQTTRELRAIVDSMPGPSLPADAAVPTATQSRFADPLAETLARLHHVEELIADITRIIESMPWGDNRAAALAEVPPQPVPTARSEAVLPPVPVPDGPASVTKTRLAFLLGGGAIAVAIGIYLRWNFMRKRPTRKELAGTISPPAHDDAIELADIMASMGLAEGAVQALMERIRRDPRQALSHWLKLLDVYRQTGKQTEFENAARDMRTTFNISAGSWGSDGSQTTLEDYPHVAAQIAKLWRTPACSEYLLSLLADNRGGKREGFPLPVAEEIVLLLAVLNDGQ